MGKKIIPCPACCEEQSSSSSSSSSTTNSSSSSSSSTSPSSSSSPSSPSSSSSPSSLSSLSSLSSTSASSVSSASSSSASSASSQSSQSGGSGPTLIMNCRGEFVSNTVIFTFNGTTGNCSCLNGVAVTCVAAGSFFPWIGTTTACGCLIRVQISCDSTGYTADVCLSWDAVNEVCAGTCGNTMDNFGQSYSDHPIAQNYNATTMFKIDCPSCGCSATTAGSLSE